MRLIPAIDILNGQVVRLHKGEYDQVTVFDPDPVTVAKRFKDHGSERIHVVDLEGARDGCPRHLAIIEDIVRATDVEVQVGGGIRDRFTAERWLEAGAKAVVFGTAAVQHPEMVAAMCKERPDGVIVAIDARDGRVAVEGWLRDSGHRASELAQQADAWGVSGLLYTDIERDGTGEGPNVTATRELQETVRASVIASGGIGSLEHLRALKDAGIRAAVCGRAIYSGAFSLEDAFRVCEAD